LDKRKEVYKMSERWKPEEGEQYWIIAFSEVVQSEWREDCADLSRWRMGNCFKTKEEAESAAEKVKALLLSLHDNGETLQDSIQDKQLPDWCKVGEWVYSDFHKKYLKIGKINTNPIYCSHPIIFFEDDRYGGLITPGTTPNSIVYKHLKQARLRPYNADEMKALVGKVLETKRGSAKLITQYIAGLNELCFWENRLNADMLLSEEYIIAGKPAGVLEHLENGEWVE
jgi:hypothetical protein